MDTTSELTLKIDDGIKSISKVCSLLSTIVAVPTLALICLCVNRISKRYSMLQILLVMQVNVNQLFLNLVLNPIFLFPVTCIIRRNPLIRLPGSAALHYEIWVAVQIIGSRWRLPNGSCYIVFFCIFVCSAWVIVLLKYSESSTNEEHTLLQNLQTHWPMLPVIKASCFEHSYFMYFTASTTSFLIISTICSAIMSWHTLATLKHASTLSYTIKKFHSSMTKALIIQAMSPVFLIMLPFIFGLVALMVNVGGPIPFSLSYLTMTLHALVHPIILITVTPMYRTKLIGIFKGKNRTFSISDGTLMK